MPSTAMECWRSFPCRVSRAPRLGSRGRPASRTTITEIGIASITVFATAFVSAFPRALGVTKEAPHPVLHHLCRRRGGHAEAARVSGTTRRERERPAEFFPLAPPHLSGALSGCHHKAAAGRGVAWPWRAARAASALCCGCRGVGIALARPRVRPAQPACRDASRAHPPPPPPTASRQRSSLGALVSGQDVNIGEGVGSLQTVCVMTTEARRGPRLELTAAIWVTERGVEINGQC